MSDEAFCKDNIEKMLKRSQTKVIFPIIAFGLLRNYIDTNKTLFSDIEIRASYSSAVREIKEYLKHDFHIGGKYYDAYPARNLPKYGIVKVLSYKQYQLLPTYTANAEALIKWIPERIRQYIIEKLGRVPELGNLNYRAKLSANKDEFTEIVRTHIGKNGTNFEIFSFAVIKIHLEKFACKVYRDTKTSAHDKGVDLSTNFGVVYQIKKLRVYNKSTADNIYSELKMNFDSERLTDGSVILVIDEVSKEIKNYLINMKVQSISKNDILKLTEQFDESEDREKVLRVVYDEFRREYSSDIK
ncbi:MAG: hypothetical protein HW402_1001 [Dehalococcoidales bacterium]|nr:hypothetical protein [Dehalococcoidales bacterium]